MKIALKKIVFNQLMLKGLSFLSLFAASIGVFNFVQSTHVYAAFDDLPVVFPARDDGRIHMSTRPNSGGANGGAGAIITSTTVVLYSKNRENRNGLRINISDNDSCEGKTNARVKARVNDMQPNGTVIPSGYADLFDRPCSTDGDIFFNIPAERWVQSTKPNLAKEGIWTTSLNIRIDTTGTSDSAFSYYVGTGTSSVRVGVLGGSQYSIKTFGSSATYEIVFRTPCNASSGNTAYFRWRDADSEVPGVNPATITYRKTAQKMRISQQDPANNGPIVETVERDLNSRTSSDPNFVTKGGENSDPIEVEPNSKFRYTFSPINTNNAMAFVQPYDSADYYLDCVSNNPEGILDVGCRYIRVAAYDRVASERNTGRGTYYQVLIVNPSGTSTRQIYDGTRDSYTKTGNISIDLSNELRSGERRFILLARDIETGNMVRVVDGNYPPVPNNTASPNDRCNYPEQWPTFSVDVTCDGIYIRNMNDNNDNGNGVRVFGQYLRPNAANNGTGAENWNLAGAIPEQNRISSGTNAHFIPWPYEMSGRGEAWAMDIGVYDLRNNGTDQGQLNYVRAIANSGCLQASCEVNIPTVAPLPANSVKAGINFRASVTISNPVVNVSVRTYNHPQNPYGGGNFGAAVPNVPTPNRSIPDSIGGSQLIARGNGGDFGLFQDFLPSADSAIPRGGSYTGPEMNFTARSSVGTQVISPQAGFHTRYDISDVCPKTVNVYQPYLITPTSALNAQSEEDPEQVWYSAGITQTTTGTNADGSPYYASPLTGVNVNASLKYYKYQSTSAPPAYDAPDLSSAAFNGQTLGTRTYGSTNAGQPPLDGLFWSDQVPGFDFRPGDRWHAGDVLRSETYVSHHTGWIGPGNNIVDNRPTSVQSTPITILDRPYARFYGGDIIGGGTFGGAGGSGSIKAYSETNQGDPFSGAGSAVEFAALAVRQISGFSSASLRTVDRPLPASGLSFKEMGSTISSPDYYASGIKYDDSDILRKVTGNTSYGPLSHSGADDNKQTHVTGTLRLTGNEAYSGHHAIFVDGDVIIEDSIAFANAEAGWEQIRDIPAFDLIVKGNIYINGNVTRLDGTYIAQPKNGNGGKIYTCANNGTLFAESSLYGSCNNQLRVNGMFIAEDLQLLRTKNTLRDIPYTETRLAPNSDRRYKRETFGTTTTPDDLAAESFRLPPDYFLAKRAIRPEGSQTNGKFDYYVSLPPVL